MAATWKVRAIARSFGKRFSNQIFRDPAPISLFPTAAARRGVHASAYDKNIDELVQPSVVPDDVIGNGKPVPDDVIGNGKPDKYWGPHPETGVFGPAKSNGSSTGKQASGNGSASVLEQKVWFRPQEDVDKPPPHN